MSPGELVAEQLAKMKSDLAGVKYVLFGVHDKGGLVDQISKLSDLFANWVADEAKRRDAVARAQIIALGSACLTLLGLVVMLVLALTTGSRS